MPMFVHPLVYLFPQFLRVPLFFVLVSGLNFLQLARRVLAGADVAEVSRATRLLLDGVEARKVLPDVRRVRGRRGSRCAKPAGGAVPTRAHQLCSQRLCVGSVAFLRCGRPELSQRALARGRLRVLAPLHREARRPLSSCGGSAKMARCRCDAVMKRLLRPTSNRLTRARQTLAPAGSDALCGWPAPPARA